MAAGQPPPPPHLAADVVPFAAQVHVGKWQRKLEQLFYGSSLAYDRGLAG